MIRHRSNGKVNFNFTNDQQERWTLLYAETKRIYPELLEDDVQRERTKVILAHYIINEDKITKDMKDMNEITEGLTEI
jgi:hypothetical protein